ncbi:hypothetical protein RJ639_038201 [Escallonia herrerae]|uniref:DC1 domain-containing protein n=1 Tax=Escallonia herrerae TaxID=1293975 RepID=A0AA88WKX4_9ASTE|nr:hypothetical protein RJ639_038201 [Escallonia herrerae]
MIHHAHSQHPLALVALTDPFTCTGCKEQGAGKSEMKFPVHPHPLKLLPPSLTTSSSGDPAAGFTCSECKRKRLGRVYRCTRATDQHCDYYLHAVCAKSFINGLQANGIKNSDIKPSMLGPAARLASQVIIEFIGGLFEGFGEAVGQALIQNIARGRCGSSRRSNY